MTVLAAASATTRTTAAPVSLLALKLAAGAWAVHEGFTHVSDDDYARVVIAERWVHAPSLDPSGTSWLPWPFWVNGAAMAVFGRSLHVATVLAWLLGLASVLVGYAALRVAGVPRLAAWIAAALAATTPWNVWLGVATVPEALAGALTFFGAMTLAATPATSTQATAFPRPGSLGRLGHGAGSRVLGGAALLAAALSRYEAWPVCATFALLCAVDLQRAPSGARKGLLGATALACSGPCLWIAWNAYAHGSALHFLARVATFHGAHAGELPLAARLLAPLSTLVSGAPEIALVGALGLAGALVDGEVRARWTRPLAGGAALVMFLAAGEVAGGAPTHHPARALLYVFWVLAGFGVDGARAVVLRVAWARPRREAWAVALGVAAAGTLIGARMDRLQRPPGASTGENRAAQIAMGLRLRGAAASHLTLGPCDFEHFALIAAYGYPENVAVLPPSGQPVTAGCPTVSAAP